MGFTSFDHFQPASNTPRPIVAASPNLSTSICPCALNLRVSSGDLNPFVNFSMVEPPVRRDHHTPAPPAPPAPCNDSHRYVDQADAEALPDPGSCDTFLPTSQRKGDSWPRRQLRTA